MTTARSSEEISTNFREAMARLAAGVTVVTTWIDNRPWGLTVSACCSVSMNPPLLLVCLGSKLSSTASILEQECFGVNLVTVEHEAVARKASTPGTPKFLEEFVADKGAPTPAIEEALAYVHCNMHSAIRVGDHTIVIGLVQDVRLGEMGPPLLYFHRQYGSFEHIGPR